MEFRNWVGKSLVKDVFKQSRDRRRPSRQQLLEKKGFCPWQKYVCNGIRTWTHQVKDVLINLVLKWWISFVSITEYPLHHAQIPIETDHHNIRVMIRAKEIIVGEDTIFKYFYVFQHSANPRSCDTVNCSDRAPIRSCFTLLFSVKGISLTNKDRRMPSPNDKKPEDDKGQV